MTSVARTNIQLTTALLVTLFAVGCSFPKDEDADTGEVGGQPTSGSTLTPPNSSGNSSTDAVPTSAASEATDLPAAPDASAPQGLSDTTYALNPSTDDSASLAASTSRETSPAGAPTSASSDDSATTSDTNNAPDTTDTFSRETDWPSTMTEVAQTSEVESATSELDSTSDVATTAPWTPIDWLAPPNGQRPFALPEQYANIDWFDVRRTGTLATHYDAKGCTTTYDTGGGELGFIECFGQWACECYRGLDIYKWVHLPSYFVDTSANTGEACRLAAAFCHTDVPPTTTDCEDSGLWGGVSAHGCVRDDACTFRHPTDYGEITEFVLMPYIECFVTEELFLDGKSTYRCFGNDIAGFDLRGKLDGEAGRTTQNACDVGNEVFYNGVDPGSEGPLECAQVPFLSPIVEAVNGEERTCRARYTCQRSATSLGEEVFILYPEQAVTCSSHQGTWTCPCDGGQRYTWSDIDGFTACNNGLTACLSHIVE